MIPTRCVIELWAGREAREERERNEAGRAEIAEREQADQFQTGQLAETVAKLQAVGLEPRISDDRSTLVFDGGAIEIRVGEFTDRPVSFDRRGPASIALDTLLSLVDRATVDE